MRSAHAYRFLGSFGFCVLAVASSIGCVIAAGLEKKPLIYISGQGPDYVYVYDQTKLKLETLFAYSQPENLAVDRSGNLYVTALSTTNVAVFAPGSQSPFLEIADPYSSNPDAVAVANDGTVYVASFYEGFDRKMASQISVYKPGDIVPDYTLPVPGSFLVMSIAVDPSKNVYVLYEDQPGTNHVREFSPASRAASIDLGLDIGKDQLDYDVALDGSGNILVSNAATDAVELFPPGATEPTMKFAQGLIPRYMAFTSDGSELWVGTLQNGVYLYAYPSGTLIKKYDGPPSQIEGMATAPAPPF